MRSGRDVLHDHVTRFNSGVRSGDFTPMLERFAENAVLEFEGVPVAPFAGRDEIARAYAEQPPDDEVAVLDVREADGEVVAGYAWTRAPGTRAGEIRLTADEGEIRRLVVTFDGEAE